MIILFIHQNFPGQFRHIAEYLGKKGTFRVIGLGDVKNIPKGYNPKGVTVMGYPSPNGAGEQTHHYIKSHEADVRRGQQVVRAILKLKQQGLTPDVVVSHTGWGEALFLRPVLPQAKIIQYCEFFYTATGADVGFDPEFPSREDNQFRLVCENATQLLSLVQADMAISPTEWQKSLYPKALNSNIKVLHEGVDTSLMCPDPNATFCWGGAEYTKHDKVVTYVARNLEPYRGFHSFMRSIPNIQAQNPDATIFIVGGNDVSYGARLANGQTYRERYISELAESVNWDKVIFTDKLNYGQYRRLLQVSSAHVYLTYPFVLSWSFIEAMSIGCPIIASETSPLREAVEDGINALYVDFFDIEDISKKVTLLLNDMELREKLSHHARSIAVQRFDQVNKVMPEWDDLITKLFCN